MRRIFRDAMCLAAAIFLCLSVVGLRAGVCADKGSSEGGAGGNEKKSQVPGAKTADNGAAGNNAKKLEAVANVLKQSLQDPPPKAADILMGFMTKVEPLIPAQDFRKAVVKALSEKEQKDLKACLDQPDCVSKEYAAALARLKMRLSQSGAAEVKPDPGAKAKDNATKADGIAPLAVGNETSAKGKEIVPQKKDRSTSLEEYLRGFQYSATVLTALCSFSLLALFALLLTRRGKNENRPVARAKDMAQFTDLKRKPQSQEAATHPTPEDNAPKQDDQLKAFLTKAVQQLVAALASSGKKQAEELQTQLAGVHERLDSIAADAHLAASWATNQPVATATAVDVGPQVTDTLLRIERGRLASTYETFLVRSGDVLELLQGRDEVENESFLRQEVGVDLVRSLHGMDRLQDYCKRTVEDLVRFYEVMNTLKLVAKMISPDYPENPNKELQLRSYARYTSFLNSCINSGTANILQSFKLNKWLREEFLAFSEAFLREYMNLELRGEETGLAEAKAIVLRALDMVSIEPIPMQIGRTLFNDRDHRAKSTVSESSMPQGAIAGIVRVGFRRKTGEIIQQPEVLVNRI
jgi:hypothetical protein